MFPQRKGPSGPKNNDFSPFALSARIADGYARGYTVIPELVESAPGELLTLHLNGVLPDYGVLIFLSVRAAQVIPDSAITATLTVEYVDDATAQTIPGCAIEPTRDPSLAANSGLVVLSRHVMFKAGQIASNARLHVGVDPGATGILLSGGSVCLSAIVFPTASGVFLVVP